MADLKTVLTETLAKHAPAISKGRYWVAACKGCDWRTQHPVGYARMAADEHAKHVADVVNTAVMFDANRILEITQMRGMIWWLASDLAADDPDSTPETWVALAEKHWQLGLRSETRFLNLAAGVFSEGATNA